jgi:hypothetical protein
MNATGAQLWCKFTASNDALSQMVCLANLALNNGGAQAAAPAVPAQVDQSGGAAMAVIAIVVCILIIRAALRYDVTPKPKPTQRVEPKL